MFSALLFIFFCFFGLLAAIFHLLRRQDQAVRLLRDEHAQIRVLLRAVESRLDYLATAVLDPAQAASAEERDATRAGRGATPPEAPGLDPLLRLSFEQPGASPQTDGRQAGGDPALELHFEPGDTPLSGQQR